MTDLISVKQGRDESISDYFKRFKEIKNRCFNLSISDKDSADVALNGLHLHFKEKLENFEYYSINQLRLRALNQEYRFQTAKDTYKTHHSNIHVVDYDSDSSGDNDKEVYTAEFVWPSQSNLVLVHHLSRLKIVGKRRSNLLLMFPNLIKYFMNYCVWDISRFLMPYSRLRS